MEPLDVCSVIRLCERLGAHVYGAGINRSRHELAVAAVEGAAELVRNRGDPHIVNQSGHRADEADRGTGVWPSSRYRKGARKHRGSYRDPVCQRSVNPSGGGKETGQPHVPMRVAE